DPRILKRHVIHVLDSGLLPTRDPGATEPALAVEHDDRFGRLGPSALWLAHGGFPAGRAGTRIPIKPPNPAGEQASDSEILPGLADESRVFCRPDTGPGRPPQFPTCHSQL